jgi:hypothetical protein
MSNDAASMDVQTVKRGLNMQEAHGGTVASWARDRKRKKETCRPIAPRRSDDNDYNSHSAWHTTSGVLTAESYS